jgi:hypothetical protein
MDADHLSTAGLAVAWECLCFYDTVLFFLTLYRTIQTRRSQVKSSLLSLIFIDGEIHSFFKAVHLFNPVRQVLSTSGKCLFTSMVKKSSSHRRSVMVLANLANIFTFYVS